MVEKEKPQVSGLLGAPMPTSVSWPDPTRLIKSGARVLEILEWFSDIRRRAVAQEIAAALDLPISSANDLLKSLVESGHLLFDREDKQYFPSPRVLRLSNSVLPSSEESGSLSGMMRAVQARTGECVAVSAQNGHRMQFISVLPTPGVVLNEIHAGLKFALVGSASGAAILATKTDTEIISIVRKVMAGRSSRERSDTVELTLEHARLARKNRFAVSFLDPLPFAMSIAIMLRDPVAGVPWALCIGGSKSDLQGREHEMATAMRQTVANFVFAGGAG